MANVLLDLKIGRDGNEQDRSSVLKISNAADGKVLKKVGSPGSVPQTVSRNHLQLTIYDNNTCVASNISQGNSVYVQGMQIQTKQLRVGDRIELGSSHYPIDWDTVRSMIPFTIDISPLKAIKEKYDQDTINIRKRQQRLGLLASIPMAFSMLGGLISGVMPEIREYALVFTGIALVIMFYGLYRRFTDKSIEEQEQLKKRFQRQYVCPNPKCNRFLGFQDYYVIAQNSACPYCKTKIAKK